MALEDMKLTRMQDTYKLVNELTGEGDDLQKKCRSRLTGLPAMLLTHGFGQTAVFLAAKADDKHKEYGLTLRFLCELVGVPGAASKPLDKMKVCAEIANGDSSQHRLWLQNALVYSEWLKRWAEALLKSPDGDDESLAFSEGQETAASGSLDDEEADH